jgi:hypothetical protein
MTEHYHVVTFIDGCLNDYDSGPIEGLEDARAHLAEYVDQDDWDSWEPAGVDRFVGATSPYILKIESCCDCEEEISR